FYVNLQYVIVPLIGSVSVSSGGSEENNAFPILGDKISVSISHFLFTKASYLKLLAYLLWHMLRSHSFSHWYNACLHRH
ncbi:hypothetical protein MKX03_027799, partial [Papaver bracteatum]